MSQKQKTLLKVLIPLFVAIVVAVIFLFSVNNNNNASKEKLPQFDSRSVTDSLKTFYGKYALTGSKDLLSSKLVSEYSSKKFNVSYVQQLTQPQPLILDPVACSQNTASSVSIKDVVVTNQTATANVVLSFMGIGSDIKIAVGLINEDGPKIDEVTCPKTEETKQQ